MAAHVSRIGVALAAILAAGCVESGDFGRPRRSFWNDTVLPNAGAARLAAAGVPLSSNPLTNDEEELRNRAWRYIMPAYERSVFDGVTANLARTHILPAEWVVNDAAAYHQALMGVPFRSPSSRYRRISDDAVADRVLIAPFRAVAGRVLSADRARARAMEGIADLSPADIDNAEWRMTENIGLIAFVRERVAIRLCQYRFALDHLVVEAPQSDAIPVERSLAALEQESRALDRLDIGSLVGTNVTSQTGPWVRPLPLCRPIVVAIPAQTITRRPGLVTKD